MIIFVDFCPESSGRTILSSYPASFYFLWYGSTGPAGRDSWFSRLDSTRPSRLDVIFPSWCIPSCLDHFQSQIPIIFDFSEFHFHFQHRPAFNHLASILKSSFKFLVVPGYGFLIKIYIYAWKMRDCEWQCSHFLFTWWHEYEYYRRKFKINAYA